MEQTKEQLFIDSYKEHADALFRFCYMKLSDRERAKDVLQDIFLRAWQYVQKGNSVENMKSFLFSIARNAVIDEYRKKKTSSLDVLQESGFDVGVDTRENIIDTLDGERALAFLGSLPEKYRDALYLHYVEGLNIGEIADIVEETENNVSVRIHRGLQKLREMIAEQQTGQHKKEQHKHER